MRHLDELPLSTPPLSSGLNPRLSRSSTKSTKLKTPAPEDQANALYNNMAGPHPDATHAIYPDRGSPPPHPGDASRRREAARKQGDQAHRRGDYELSPASQQLSPDHAVQSGRTNRARDRYYGRDKGARKRMEDQAGQQSRQAGATAVQMGVGGVPEAATVSTAGMPTLAEDGRCVIL